VPRTYGTIKSANARGWERATCPQKNSKVKISSCIIPAEAKFGDCSKADILQYRELVKDRIINQCYPVDKKVLTLPRGEDERAGTWMAFN
jgi:hypothetical protein